MKGRRDMMRLLFWGKIVGMSHSRLAHHLYSVGRTHYQAGKQSRWCKETHALMQTIGLEHIWPGHPFRGREQVMQGKAKLLRTYQLLKDSLSFYLKYPDFRARETMTRLRGGTTNSDRDGTSQSNEQRPNTTRERASLSDLAPLERWKTNVTS